MRRTKVVYEEIRAAQAALGTGEVEEAFAAASRLRTEALELLEAGPRLTSFERSYAVEGVTYATVTLVLALAEKDPPAVAIPAIRELAQEAARSSTGGSRWKVLAAAAEMLARSGDAEGACWAAKKARVLGDGSDYLVRLTGGVQSMYPQVFARIPDDPGDLPPLSPRRSL